MTNYRKVTPIFAQRPRQLTPVLGPQHNVIGVIDKAIKALDAKIASNQGDATYLSTSKILRKYLAGYKLELFYRLLNDFFAKNR